MDTQPQFRNDVPDAPIFTLNGVRSNQMNDRMRRNKRKRRRSRSRSRRRESMSGSRSASASFCELLKDYSEQCTLHCVHYVFRENATIFERSIWLSIIILCFVCASLLVNTMWIRFSLAPTVTVVKDTHFPLHLFPFPAVTICPNLRIKKTIAVNYLSRFVNVSDSGELNQVMYFLNVLSLFQHPRYSRMLEHLDKCQPILAKLEQLNITDLMIQVLPKCEEIFLECWWHGKPENCCRLFSVQQSEEGFCYSFNSMTSQMLRHCEPESYKSDTKSRRAGGVCMLRRNTAAGTATGIEVFLKQIDPNESLPNQLDVTGPSGMQVQIHDVTEYPEAGMGVLIPEDNGLKMSIRVKPALTQSTHSIRNLAIYERNCYFADEKRLAISKAYTEKSCLIECRLNYLYRVCGCLPYYFNIMRTSAFTTDDGRGDEEEDEEEGEGQNVCNATQLRCVAHHSEELRFFSPPSGILRGFEGTEMFSPLNCSGCLPTCNENLFDLDNDLMMDSSPTSKTSFGYLDIYYRNEGAVKYQRDVTFGWIDLLVSFGGIAGLFLGFSLLSIIEFIYWTIKILCHVIALRYNHRNDYHPNTREKQFLKRTQRMRLEKIFISELSMALPKADLADK